MPLSEQAVEPLHGPRRANVTPLRSVPLGHNRELRIGLAESDAFTSVVLRPFRTRGRGRPLEPDRPVYVFPENLPAVIAALVAAARAIGVEIPAAPAQAVHVDTSGGALPPSVTGRERGGPTPESSTHA